jgi:hypothetical protein
VRLRPLILLTHSTREANSRQNHGEDRERHRYWNPSERALDHLVHQFLVSTRDKVPGHHKSARCLPAEPTVRPLACHTRHALANAAPPSVRCNRKTGELAFYRCFTPHPTPLAVLVKVAGRRWTVEEAFQAGKGLCGLDQHQVRRWRSWYRWVTLAMLAHAFLVIAALAERTRHPVPGLIPVTCNEVRHLFAALLALPAGNRAHRLRWSAWRRRHQARARTYHYQRQAAWQP